MTKSNNSNNNQVSVDQQAEAVQSAQVMPLFDPATPQQDAVSDNTVWPVDETAPDDVKKFLLQFHPKGLVYLHNSFLAYTDGYWKKLNDHVDVQKSIARFYKADAKSSEIKELFGMLRLTCAVRAEDFKPNTNYICFINGPLNMTTYRLEQPNPHFHLLSGRPVEWVESAKSPVFEKFLHDIFRDDADRQDKIQFVLEWMGLCLVPDTTYEKFVVCVGEGGNGKSVLLKLMAELLGHENVYSAPVQRLGNRRALAELEGKLLLTSSEINENTVMDDGILKQIVSGDTVEAERKYEHPFTFTPFARIMLATNHLPKLKDVTNAFFRRLVVLRFNRNFTADGEIDMHLSAKLNAELDGVFAMAVGGLRALRSRGGFVVPQSSEDASKEYRDDSDPIKLFAEEALVKTSGEHRMRPAALYSFYANWSRSFGFDLTNNIVLGKFLGKLGFVKKRSNGKDYWHVNKTPAGIESAAKQFARVEEGTPDLQPDPSSVINAIKPVAIQVEYAPQAEEMLAA